MVVLQCLQILPQTISRKMQGGVGILNERHLVKSTSQYIDKGGVLSTQSKKAMDTLRMLLKMPKNVSSTNLDHHFYP